MSASTKAPSGVQTRISAFEDFQGLDSSRDRTALDTQKKQHLSGLNNGFCDWRGQITRDPGITRAYGTGLIRHVAFYSARGIAYAEQDGAAVNLVSDTGQAENGVYARNSVVTSTVFSRRLHLFSKGQQSWSFDGTNWKVNQSRALDKLRPAFGVAVSRRMAVAGIPGRETEVHLSRVDDASAFPDDEDIASTNVLRAGKIDVANFLGSSEEITALARFEQNKLAIFTSDRCVLFTIDPSIAFWSIDERANINFGCISQNTVAMAGEDVLFCSRSGVHSLSRSTDNGITITSSSIGDKVDILYRQLLATCEDPTQISATFDQDMGQYHVYFPQGSGEVCKRLTVTIKPGAMDPKWSTGDFANERCGAFQAGVLYYGTPHGVYSVAKIESNVAGDFPPLVITTPLLWHGSFTETKATKSFMMQASGDADITVEAIDDEGKTIHVDTFQASDSPDDNNFSDVPLSRQYERRFECRYRAVQFRITAVGKGLFRLVGFAVVVKKD